MFQVNTIEADHSNDNFKVTEVELIYRNKTKSSEHPIVRISNDAYDILYKSWDMNKIELQEQFKIMLLDRKNSCIGISTLATGGISGCLVDLKIAFATALKSRASCIILAHNHPSGSTIPSEADKSITQKFTEAGRLLDLNVLDHLIITKEGYTSFADEGLITRSPKP
ncbi:MAG: JAB domain-containing protein [Verrucomicrobia bacterium]|nr:JAB domain-containing protein [Verrucomicrobiota bacterium]